MATELKGLSTQEVEERVKKFGYNELQTKERSAFLRLLQRFWGPIPWMIEVAAILSFSAHRMEDFYIIMTLLLVNAFVDFIKRRRL